MQFKSDLASSVFCSELFQVLLSQPFVTSWFHDRDFPKLKTSVLFYMFVDFLTRCEAADGRVTDW